MSLLKPMKESSLRRLQIAEQVFRVLFFVYTCLDFIILTTGSFVISVVMWPTFALGAVLLLLRAAYFSRYRAPYKWLLVLTLFAGGVSVLLHTQYELKKNVVYMILWAFYFGLLYLRDPREKPASAQKELRFFGTVFTVFAQICVIVSVVMLFCGYSLKIETDEIWLHAGFVNSRLYGMYVDPNIGSVCSILAILFSVRAFSLYKRVWQRVLLVIGMLLDLFYVALSDSRTGMVTLGVTGFVYVLGTLLFRAKTKKQALVAVLCSVLTALVCFVAPRGVKTAYNEGVKLWVSCTAEEEDPDVIEQMQKELTVERGYDLTEDVSNRRFDVWQSGFEVFAKNPVFGTSYTGFRPWAKENLPQTYIVNNDYMDMGTFDNELINLLVSTGLLGFLPFMAFAVAMIVWFVRHIGDTAPPFTGASVTAIAGLFGIACSAMFRNAILYYNSCVATMFWLMLGLLPVLCARPKEEPV